MPQKIVFTGGPSAGKTTLIKTLVKSFHPELCTVPETASILYQGGFHRSSVPAERIHVQRAIYFVQKESEAIVALQNPKAHLLCDRGTLDGLAYWPKEGGSFYEQFNTNLEQELQNYQWVLHLDSACAQGYDSSNPIRLESPAEAQQLNQRILEVWSQHPQRFVIKATQDFIKKARLVQAIVRRILNGQSHETIQSDLYRFL